jgi:RNA polymerase sigma factor (sigma-70 family)
MDQDADSDSTRPMVFEKVLLEAAKRIPALLMARYPEFDENEREEVQSEILVKLAIRHAHGRSAPTMEELPSYLVRAMHLAVSEYRRSKSITASTDTESEPAIELAKEDETSSEITEVLASLPENQQIVLKLTMEGYSRKEIAEQLQLSQRITDLRYRRALRRMRDALALLERRGTVAPGEDTTSERGPTDFEIYIQPGTGDTDDVRNVLRALNDLHIAYGGLGLDFRIDGLLVKAREEALT